MVKNHPANRPKLAKFFMYISQELKIHPKNLLYEAKNKAQTLPKQVQNNFEKVEKSTFLTFKMVENDPSDRSKWVNFWLKISILPKGKRFKKFFDGKGISGFRKVREVFQKNTIEKKRLQFQNYETNLEHKIVIRKLLEELLLSKLSCMIINNMSFSPKICQQFVSAYYLKSFGHFQVSKFANLRSITRGKIVQKIIRRKSNLSPKET